MSPADSRTGRLLASAQVRVGGVWDDSRTAAALRCLRAFALRALAGSALLSLSAAGSRPLREAVSPSSSSRLLGGIAALSEWLVRHLAGGPLGRAVRRGALSAGRSVVLAGYVRLAGTALLALAVGRIYHGLHTEGSGGAAVGWVAVAALGGVVLSVGPAFSRAFRTSLSQRATLLASGGSVQAASGPRAPAEGSFLAPAALALVALSGFLAGGASGRLWLVLPAVAVALVAAWAGLLRPELILLALAAFPWVDYAFGLAVGGRAALLDAVLLVGALIALLIAVFVTGRWRLRTVPLTLPLMTMFLFAVASVTLTNVRPPIAFFAIRLTFQSLLFYLIGYLLPRDRVWVGRTVGVFLLSATLLAAHGLLQVATHAPMPAKWIDAHEDIGTRAYSIVQNPNGLGAFLALAALLGISLTLARLPRSQRLATGALTVVLLAGLAVTYSRGAWIGFGLGLLVLVAVTQARLFWALVAAIVVSPLLLPRALVARLTFAFSSAYVAKSATAGRLYIWNVALHRVAEHPLFGVGLGTFGGTSAFLYASGRYWIDNYYLQLAAEGGLLLLFAFLWVLVRAAKGLVRSRRRQTDPYQRAVVAGVLAGFVAVVVANVTASVWETVVVAAGFWFLTGFASSLEPGEDPLPALSQSADELPDLPLATVGSTR